MAWWRKSLILTDSLGGFDIPLRVSAIMRVGGCRSSLGIPVFFGGLSDLGIWLLENALH